MSIEQLTATLVILLLLTLVARPVAGLLRLPFTSVLVIVGFVVSEAIVYAGIDTGLRAENFQTLVFYVFIPLLVFESAFQIDKQKLLADLVPVLFLAVLGMLLTCAIASVLLFYGIGHAEGFPWIAALLTGSILAATDPVAVVDRLKSLRAPPRLSVLLEGESLFNDATAIVLFSLFLSLAVTMAESQTAGLPIDAAAAALRFCLVFFGGALVGCVIGWLCGFIDGLLRDVHAGMALTLVAAYGSYMIAEMLHVSGVMSTLGAGLVMSVLSRRQASPAAYPDTARTWSFLVYLANAIVFLIVGAVITFSMFEERWLAMLIAIAAILIARAVSVYGSLSLLALGQERPVGLREQTIMVWGGLRGAVTLALALSLPVSLPYWWTIQSIAFGVVLFTLFVQATSIALLVADDGAGGD